jgi:hypothetical protein
MKQTTKKHRSALLVNLTFLAVLLLPIVYVLSYPIVLSLGKQGRQPPEIAMYRPIEAFLSDHYWIQDAMCIWADCFDDNGRELVLLRILKYRINHE